MKKKRKRTPSWGKGYRATLMKLLLSIGVVTYKSLDISENKEMYLRAVRKLKKEGYIKEHKNRGNRALSLYNFDEKYKDYIEAYEKGYYGYYRRYCRTITNYVTEYQRQYAEFMMAVRDSEAAVFMYEAGAGTLMEDKVQLRKPGMQIKTSDSYYYRTAEIKETWNEGENENEKLVFGRMRCNGWLTCTGGEYLIYHVCKSQIRWFKTSELNYAGYIRKLCRDKKENTDVTDITEAVILAYTDEVFTRMVNYEKVCAENLNVNNGHKTMYGITYDKNGLELMRLMMKKQWKEELKNCYLTGMKKNSSVSYSACHAYDGDTKVLLFCIPDLVRLKIFISQAIDETAPEKNKIICFDTQKDFIQRTALEHCTVETYSLAEYIKQAGNKQ